MDTGTHIHTHTHIQVHSYTPPRPPKIPRLKINVFRKRLDQVNKIFYNSQKFIYELKKKKFIFSSFHYDVNEVINFYFSVAYMTD